MSFSGMVSDLTPALREQFAMAIATGRWPDGREVSAGQKDLLIQTLLLWQAKHENQRDEPFTLNEQGEIRLTKPKREPEQHQHSEHESPDEYTLQL